MDDQSYPPDNASAPVYISRTVIGGVSHPSITNIGYKPTVGAENKKGVETFIYDFDRDLYGVEIDVELLSYKRPEIRFDNIEDLKLQMKKDLEYGRKFFGI